MCKYSLIIGKIRKTDISQWHDSGYPIGHLNRKRKIRVQECERLQKQGATYNACAANKADRLLAAKYKVDVKDFFVYKNVTAQVTGYPGVIKGVK